MADPRTWLAALAAGILLAAPLAGCGTEPDRWRVVDMRHDPDEVWYGGGVALRGTWELRVCPDSGECVWQHVSEEDYAETEVGDRVEIRDAAMDSEEPR